MACHRSARSALLRAAAALMLLASLPVAALAQGGGCVLTPDKQHPGEKILRCGADLTVRPADGTVYRPFRGGATGLPPAVELDDGALLIEFHGGKRPREFQILTPEAIASVRGTRWAVETKPGQTSVLVLEGVVEVARVGANAGSAVLLHEGEGVDVKAGAEPLQVKRWASARVNALLARFGQ